MFVKVKTTSAPNSPPSKPWQGQGQSQGARKPYTGPTELKGPASEKQVNKINEFLNDQNPKVQEAVTKALTELNVGSPEELSKQDASTVLQAGFDAKGKMGFKKK
jgi:hypothetical protein